MHCHVYNEAVSGNGGNNIASLIMKTLESVGHFNDEQPGRELNIILDNCTEKKHNIEANTSHQKSHYTYTMMTYTSCIQVKNSHFS